METKLTALAASTCLALYALTGLAVAQTAPSPAPSPAPGSAASSRNADVKSLLKKADSDFNAAKAACKPMKGAEAKSCLQEARATYQQAKLDARGVTRDANLRGSTPSSLPALQTQSPAVSATGIAQTPVGANVTPGTPAVPKK